MVVVRGDTAPATFWLSKDTVLDSGDTLIASKSKAGRVTVKLPTTERDYVIVQQADGATVAVAA